MLNVHILKKRYTFFLFLLFLFCKTYSRDFDFGFFIDKPYHININKSNGLRNVSLFDNNFGFFLCTKPDKKIFGFKLDFSRLNQTCSYKILDQKQIKNYFTFTSKNYELSLHVFNYYKTKMIIEYGFSFKSRPKIKMVEFEKTTKSGFFNISSNQSNGIGLMDEINRLQKQTTYIIPSIQLGFSYIFKKISIGSQISIDVLPFLKQPYFILEEKYSIYPQYFSMSIFIRFHLKSFFTHVH